MPDKTNDDALAERLRYAALTCADAAQRLAIDFSPSDGTQIEQLANAARALTEASAIAGEKKRSGKATFV